MSAWKESELHKVKTIIEKINEIEEDDTAALQYIIYKDIFIKVLSP